MELGKLKEILKLYDIYPTKGKGQNFLIDEKALDQIVASADLKSADRVLEIGPGLGILTQKLIANAGVVLAVELDKKIINYLQANFSDAKNLEILESDILKIKNQEIFNRLGGDYKVVANIPYNITSPVIQKFLNYEPKPVELILLVQKEVGERICAQAGDMSILAVSVQFYAQPEIVGYISKKAFWPEPAVDSVILRIRTQNTEQRTQEEIKGFFQVVKIGFSARRKKLYNNLAAGLKLGVNDVKNALRQIGLNENVRAQDLSVDNWLNLVKELRG